MRHFKRSLMDFVEKGDQVIYKIEGDTLTICGSTPGKPRPTDFSVAGNPDVILFVLKRVNGAK